MDTHSLRVIGPGRAGQSLARGLEKAGWRVLPPVHRTDDPTTAAAGCDLLVIATPDTAIAEVAAAVTPVESTVICHLSGSTPLSVLDGHPRRAAVHPLRACPTPTTDLAGAWFAVAGDPLGRRVVADLEGRPVEVADADRAAYHAAAVVASNHLVALLGQVERVASTAGVPVAAFFDLIRGTVENAAVLGPAGALTGPVARGDWSTVRSHLGALPEGERPAYLALARLAARLAGRALPADLGEVAR